MLRRVRRVVAAVVFVSLLVPAEASADPSAKKTATKLALVAGTSLVGTGGLVAAIALTGASRRVVGPLAGATIVVGGVFFTSLLAGLYATLAPEGGTGAPVRATPTFETALGAYALHDPIFDPGGLVLQRVDMRVASFRGSVQAEVAPGISSRRLRAETALRLHGPVPKHDARDGTYLDLEGAVTDHAHREDGFGTTVVEASVRGRLDLARVDDALDGAFADGQVGAGFLVDRYRATSGSDVGSLLVGGFAFGVYLGRPSPDSIHGEAKLFYEHRRDGFVGGLQPNGIPAGFLGSVGAQTRLWFGPTWGIGATAQAGSALLGGASLLFRSEVL